MSATDLITQKVLQIADHISTLLATAAPAASKVMLQMARIDAIGDLIYSIAGIIGGVGLFYIARRIFKYAVAEDRDTMGVISFMLGIFAIATFIASFATFLSIYTWIGIWHPEIYLAHELMQKVLS